IPDTTCAATRVGLSSPPGTRPEKTTKLAAPSATSVFVRRPASRLRHCRSNLITEPSPTAAAKFIATCSIERVITGFRKTRRLRHVVVGRLAILSADGHCLVHTNRMTRGEARLGKDCGEQTARSVCAVGRGGRGAKEVPGTQNRSGPELFAQ